VSRLGCSDVGRQRGAGNKAIQPDLEFTRAVLSEKWVLLSMYLPVFTWFPRLDPDVQVRLQAFLCNKMSEFKIPVVLTQL
jgi:hypothetical protein